MMKLNLMKYSKHLYITLFRMQQRSSLLEIQGSQEVSLRMDVELSSVDHICHPEEQGKWKE